MPRRTSLPAHLLSVSARTLSMWQPFAMGGRRKLLTPRKNWSKLCNRRVAQELLRISVRIVAPRPSLESSTGSGIRRNDAGKKKQSRPSEIRPYKLFSGSVLEQLSNSGLSQEIVDGLSEEIQQRLRTLGW